jgi:hypothetical protein
MITQVVSKLNDTSASTSTATHVEEDVLISVMNNCVVSCDLRLVDRIDM